jgi:hypothetical protein
MTENGPTPSGVATDFRLLQNSFLILFFLQIVLIAGMVVVFVQIGAVPSATAQQVPVSDSGGYADSMIGTIGTNITDLQAQVTSMAARIDAICIVLEKSNPTAIAPNACSAP